MLLFCFTLICFTSQAQDFRKEYITATGDTLHVGTKFKVSETVNILHIYANPYDIDGTPYVLDAVNIEKRRGYPNLSMRGNTYQIQKLGRHKVSKGKYRQIAYFYVNDYHLHPANTIVFIVDVEPAFKNKEVELIK